MQHTQRHLRSLVRLGLLLGLLSSVLATGCRSLDILGDSITRISSGALHDRFDARYLVTVDGVNGAEIHERDDTADQMAATHPWAVVVDLGTNDASLDDSDIVADFDVLIAKFTAPTCRAVVTIATPGKSSPFVDSARLLNAHIRVFGWVGSWRLVDWDDALTRYEAQGEPYGPMVSDLIHPTTMGQHWLAQQIDEALADCPE